jgi:hypothetical protein
MTRLRPWTDENYPKNLPIGPIPPLRKPPLYVRLLRAIGFGGIAWMFWG